MALDLNLTKRGTKCELKLVGKLDAQTAPGAQGAMLQLVGKFETVILDFTDLTYVSSAGLRVLKTLRMESQQKNVTLLLKGVGKPIMEVFEMTGFAVLFKYI